METENQSKMLHWSSTCILTKTIHPSEDEYNEYRKAEEKYLKVVQKLDRDFASRGRVS